MTGKQGDALANCSSICDGGASKQGDGGDGRAGGCGGDRTGAGEHKAELGATTAAEIEMERERR